MLKKSCLKVQNLQYKFLLENDPPWKFSEKSSVLAPKDKYFFLHFLVCSVCLSFCHVLSSLLGWALKHKARRWKKNKCTHLNCIKAWRFKLGHACQWPAFAPVMMMLNCLCDDDVELCSQRENRERGWHRMHCTASRDPAAATFCAHRALFPDFARLFSASAP